MNYKVKVNNEAESKEVQELFFELGGQWATCGRVHNDMVCFGDYIFLTDFNMLNYGLGIAKEEVAIQQLKDLVVLKRNSTDDATHEGKHGSLWYLGDVKYGWRFDLDKWELDDSKNNGIKWGELKPISQLKDLVVLERNDVRDATHTSYSKFYYLTNNEFYEYINNKWVNVDEFVDGLEFKAVSRDDVVNQLIQSQCTQDNLKMKEYLVPQEDGSYKLQLAYPLTAWKSWIEVPEGSDYLCEILDDLVFYKGGVVFKWWDGEDLQWYLCVDTVNDSTLEGVLWKRNNGGDVPEQFKPSKPSDLFKYDCDSVYPKMKAERKVISVTITPNDVKVKWFKKFLDGAKVQYRVISSKGWQNLTWKSLEMMKLNLEFREKPTTIEVDGMKFDTVDKLTSYLKSMTNLK